MKSTAFDRKSVAFGTKSNTNYRKSIGSRYEINSGRQEINRISLGNRNGNYRKSTRNHQENIMKSIAFDKTSIAFDTRSIRNLIKNHEKSIGNRHETNSVRQVINNIRYKINRKLTEFDRNSTGNQ